MEATSLPREMIRYCVHCKAQISESRTVKGSSFCTDACKRADKKARREYRASRACRTCGRAPLKRRKAEVTAQDELGAKAAEN